MNPAMIMCYFVYLIPTIAFFTWIFEIFLIIELVTIRVDFFLNCLGFTISGILDNLF